MSGLIRYATTMACSRHHSGPGARRRTALGAAVAWVLMNMVLSSATAAGPVPGVTPGAVPGVPVDDPVASYRLGWTSRLRWDRVVNIAQFAQQRAGADAQLEAAQDALGPEGGVVYLPAGTYEFKQDIVLRSGVVLRGASPGTGPAGDARIEGYAPPTRLEFPRYEPRNEGMGTPNDTAFKAIRLADPARAENTGLVHLSLNRVHVHLGEDSATHAAGRNRLIYGCVLRNAASAAENVPDAKAGQHAWQRWPAWKGAAVAVYSGENALVANNRLPESGDDNFEMPGYVLKGRGQSPGPVVVPRGVVFDYDNRAGIQVNLYSLGGAGGVDPKGTPETIPWGFRPGTVIRDNYVFCTGRSAIAFSGRGAVCSFNVIRFKKDVRRHSNTGVGLVSGSSTNDNRAMTVRGWGWTIEGNDYEVHKNLAADSGYYFNDGEGIMHEGHANAVIRDSRLIGNRGNAYLSLYKTAGIDGLLIEGNDIRPPGKGAAIFVDANRNWDKHPCRNVRIVNNVTSGGILIAGEPGEGNVVEGNRQVGPGGRIDNRAGARVSDNHGFDPPGP